VDGCADGQALISQVLYHRHHLLACMRTCQRLHTQAQAEVVWRMLSTARSGAAASCP
jgi:hypothetical protein